MKTAARRETSKRVNRSGTTCRSCGTTFPDCMDSLLDSGHICCSGCRYTDTHEERAEMAAPAMTDEMLVAELIALREQVSSLTGRLEVVEVAVAPKAPKRDELADKVVEFMRERPGLKVTALVVAENLGELDNAKVGGRMQTLANQGIIASSKENGRTRMYFWPVAA